MQSKINVPQIKDRILTFLLSKGPSIQIKIAKEVGLSGMFTSAILSELLNEKKVKISSLKIGSSPIYYLPGQEHDLENFSDNLYGVEKDTFLKLKKEKILFDEGLDPVTSVSLRSLKDFAISLKWNDKLIWKYFKLTNEEVSNMLSSGGGFFKRLFKEKERVHEVKFKAPMSQQEIGESLLNDFEKNKKKQGDFERLGKIAIDIKEKHEELKKEKEEKLMEAIFEEKSGKEEAKEEVKEVGKEIEAKTGEREEKKKKEKIKPENIFFNEIKAYLEERGLDIIRIEKIDKKEFFAKVQDKKGEEKPMILAAFNKKKLTSADFLKVNKKMNSFGLPYFILSKGELSKKIKEEIETFKKLAFVGEIK